MFGAKKYTNSKRKVQIWRHSYELWIIICNINFMFSLIISHLYSPKYYHDYGNLYTTQMWIVKYYTIWFWYWLMHGLEPTLIFVSRSICFITYNLIRPEVYRVYIIPLTRSNNRLHWKSLMIFSFFLYFFSKTVFFLSSVFRNWLGWISWLNISRTTGYATRNRRWTSRK